MRLDLTKLQPKNGLKITYFSSKNIIPTLCHITSPPLLAFIGWISVWSIVDIIRLTFNLILCSLAHPTKWRPPENVSCLSPLPELWPLPQLSICLSAVLAFAFVAIALDSHNLHWPTLVCRLTFAVGCWTSRRREREM